MSIYDRVAGLPLTIESVDCEHREVSVRGGMFTRATTTVVLRGAGEEGVGEDVTYDALDQIALQDAGPSLELAGTHTIESFSELLSPRNVPRTKSRSSRGCFPCA